MKISDILKSKGVDVVTALPTTSLKEAASQLASQGVGSLVIIDTSQIVVGVLAERELVAAFATDPAGAGDREVASIMQSPPLTCSLDNSVQSILGRMTRNRTRHVPVLSDGLLIGLVSLGDLVKAQLKDLEREVDVLRDTVLRKRSVRALRFIL